MKKIFIPIVTLALIFLCAFTSEKMYVFRFKETQINYHWQNLEAIKILMDQSSLPHIQVKQAVAAIDSLQKDMQRVMSIDTLPAESR
jgi:hypothetical protein